MTALPRRRGTRAVLFHSIALWKMNPVNPKHACCSRVHCSHYKMPEPQAALSQNRENFLPIRWWHTERARFVFAVYAEVHRIHRASHVTPHLN
jgi:hypothetical protein